jgi:hypothetical protein
MSSSFVHAAFDPLPWLVAGIVLEAIGIFLGTSRFRFDFRGIPRFLGIGAGNRAARRGHHATSHEMRAAWF